MIKDTINKLKNWDRLENIYMYKNDELEFKIYEVPINKQKDNWIEKWEKNMTGNLQKKDNGKNICSTP